MKKMSTFDITKESKNISLNKSSNSIINKLMNQRNLILNSKTIKMRNNKKSIMIRTKTTNIHSKTFDKISKKTEKIMKVSKEEKDTSKIDYRHFKNYPIKEILPFKKVDIFDEELYWLVTYDKLIKTKNIIKILNSNNSADKNIPIYSEASLKTAKMKIQKFEIFFVEGYDKPFVRPNKDKNNFIFAKIYLMKVNEINRIFNFINRTEDKVNINKYIYLTNKKSYDYIDFKNDLDINSDINYPYCYIYYLGKFMNISMILFTNTFNYINAFNLNNNHYNSFNLNKKILYSLPSTKKLYKLIKIFAKLFPEYKPEFIINHILKEDLYSNSKEKKKELLNLVSSIKPSCPDKLLLNKILRETITGINTNSSHSKSQLDSGENLEKINFENNLLIPKKNEEAKIDETLWNKLEKKKAIKLKINLNNKDTNYTIIQNNTFNNIMNKINIDKNISKMNISYDNIMRNEVKSNILFNEKENYYIPKRNIKIQRLNNKKINNENKENISINNILNKKKENNKLINKFGAKINSLLNHKNTKDKDSKSGYHTPKKKKIIKYYK